MRLCRDDKYFKCRDGIKCVSRELTCDNIADCPDASDESDSMCDGIVTHVSNHTCNPIKEFECEAKICIPRKLMCDGVKHCFDGRDEDPTMCKANNVKF